MHFRYGNGEMLNAGRCRNMLPTMFLSRVLLATAEARTGREENVSSCPSRRSVVVLFLLKFNFDMTSVVHERTQKTEIDSLEKENSAKHSRTLLATRFFRNSENR